MERPTTTRAPTDPVARLPIWIADYVIVTLPSINKRVSERYQVVYAGKDLRLPVAMLTGRGKNCALPVSLQYWITSLPPLAMPGMGSSLCSILGSSRPTVPKRLNIGVFEAIASQFVPATSAAILSLGLFVLILLVRPGGLMGKA